MHNENIDILNLEWSSLGRDRAIVTPVLEYLNLRYGLRIECKSIFAGEFYILRYRPKIVLLANSVGARQNVKIADFAKKHGIKVISLISEGNIFEEYVEPMTWGVKKDKRIIEDLILLWSERSAQIVLRNYNQLFGIVEVSGATGFDRYKILNFTSKNAFLRKLNLPVKPVIGYAVWAFDFLFDPIKLEDFRQYEPPEAIEAYRQDHLLVKEALEQIIKHNQDKYFLIKMHPGTGLHEKTEVYGLEKYQNVIVIQGKGDLQIDDCLSICDLWISYCSTTALEAWVLGKPTITLNPHPEFSLKTNTILGSPICKSPQELQRMIDEFYSFGQISAFDALSDARKNLIKDIIGFDDGLNHKRAGEKIYRFFLSIKKSNIEFSVREKIYCISKILQFKLSPFLALFFQRYLFLKKRNSEFKRKELIQYRENYKAALKQFHEDLGEN